MSTTIYDSSLLTMRRKATAESGSFISRIAPWNVPTVKTTTTPSNFIIPNTASTVQPTTGYAPMLGIYDQSIINTVKTGNMAFYRKNDGGCTTVMGGCPCVPAPASSS
jgi:hypothetical protein